MNAPFIYDPVPLVFVATGLLMFLGVVIVSVILFVPRIRIRIRPRIDIDIK